MKNPISDSVEFPCRIRTKSSAYIFWSIVLGPILLAWIYIACTRPKLNNWEGVAATCGLLVFALLKAYLFEVDLHVDRLAVRNWFVKTDMLYSEIERVDILWVSYRGALSNNWRIQGNASLMKRPLIIPMRAITPSDNRKIAKTLVEKAPKAHIDPAMRSAAAHAD